MGHSLATAAAQAEALEQRLRASGLAGTIMIAGFEDTGTTIDDNPEVKAVLDVTISSQPTHWLSKTMVVLA